MTRDCRCHVCERTGEFAPDVRKLSDLGLRAMDSAAQLAREVVEVAPVLEAAREQMQHAIEVARQPTTCGSSFCQYVAGSEYKAKFGACFGCSHRRVETPFISRKEW